MNKSKKPLAGGSGKGRNTGVEKDIVQRVLYHVSPEFNRQSIKDRGLLPERAANPEVHRLYLVEEWAICWAIGHVSARHKISADQIDIYQCRVNIDTLRRFRGSIWYTWNICTAFNVRPAVNYLNGYQSAAVENTTAIK